ncbi:chemotaxis protein CheB [Eleftheria terrae]|uniref:chemotaxis protein CheB n=1 Tax=Eleftheria terrae TaxID=1597781 RepID=UPI00263A8ECD|nr:chemotaxis protein CheB [Eleftheria terrae]WKB53567.1 chemotaxis protein CheB [Eleftheria terrae]
MGRRDVVAIGASAGGVQALQHLAAALPADFPAAVLVVLHIGMHRSALPRLLASVGPLPARHAVHGEPMHAGCIYVAPPDRHLLVSQGSLRLSRGPKENHSRPAIDPLLRSAAVDCRARVIGVVLTGYLDDGSAGLAAVKACGGLAVVQDPEDAYAPQMPSSALATTAVDHVEPLSRLPALLDRLVREDQPLPDVKVPDIVKIENDMTLLEGRAVENRMPLIGKPSSLTCPECHGTLWQVEDGSRLRYRCHTGHAYSELSLRESQRESTEAALWAAVRALQEEAMMAKEMARSLQALGRSTEALAEESRARDAMARAESLGERLLRMVGADAPNG